ncbi:MAG: hypothetical protein H7A25_23575 [Leptospiraceae bacterium]|nr:hypothetical protein [Leptospiraceae bacterium]MCP5502901.1 hypothetical protein [Leptospiraceae bacterium]
MNLSAVVYKPILMLFLIFFLISCPEKKTRIQKLDDDMGGVGATVVLVEQLLRAIQEGDKCQSFWNYPTLEHSIPVLYKATIKHQGNIYKIYPSIKPAKVKITILSENCSLARGYSYCTNNVRTYGNTENGLSPMDCDYRVKNYIAGNKGFYEECEVSFNSELYLVSVSLHSNAPCDFEVEYE